MSASDDMAVRHQQGSTLRVYNKPSSTAEYGLAEAHLQEKRLDGLLLYPWLHSVPLSRRHNDDVIVSG
jgi:hypothetical protein